MILFIFVVAAQIRFKTEMLPVFGEFEKRRCLIYVRNYRDWWKAI